MSSADLISENATFAAALDCGTRDTVYCALLILQAKPVSRKLIHVAKTTARNVTNDHYILHQPGDALSRPFQMLGGTTVKDQSLALLEDLVNQELEPCHLCVRSQNSSYSHG